MNYSLYFSSACRPNVGGEIAGVCMIESDNANTKPEIILVYKPASAENNAFFANHFVFNKGLEHLKATAHELDTLTIYTACNIIPKQISGDYKINVGAYQPFADASIDILIELFDYAQNGLSWKELPKERLLKSKNFIDKIIRDNNKKSEQ
jgi:ribonuclease HI